MNSDIKKILPKLIDDAPVMALYLDSRENILLCNKKARNFIGLQNADIVGKNWLKVLFRHSRNNIKKAMFKAVMDDSMTYKRPKDFECQISDKSGNKHLILWSIGLVLDKEKKIEATTLFGQDITGMKEEDITERKKLEYQILQAEKLAALGQLSAGIAHEINNPLFVISGRLEMLKQEEFNPKVKDTLSLISSQIDRIRNLVDRILRFCRKTTSTLEPIDVNEAIESVLSWVHYNKLPKAEFILEKFFEKNMPKIEGDLHQLQEVFLNLLINAHQSMPNGGKIKIITSNLGNHHVQIQIIDSGGGIPADQLKNIFMPFFTTKKEGLGLGLSICHNIIKNHNGSIELKSQVNQGSTFTIKLPFI